MSDPELPGEPELVEPEPLVVEGEDDLPRQPTLAEDPYTPAPTDAGEPRWVMRVAWIAISVIVALGAVIAVWAALR
jgi:hypothetical protein